MRYKKKAVPQSCRRIHRGSQISLLLLITPCRSAGLDGPLWNNQNVAVPQIYTS